MRSATSETRGSEPTEERQERRERIPLAPLSRAHSITLRGVFFFFLSLLWRIGGSSFSRRIVVATTIAGNDGNVAKRVIKTEREKKRTRILPFSIFFYSFRQAVDNRALGYARESNSG